MDWQDYATAWSELLKRGRSIDFKASIPAITACAQRDPRRPCCMLISPHPDDESIQAGLPLRLAQEANWQVVNLAVTFGSQRERRQARRAELAAACSHLGFAWQALDPTPELGLDDVTPSCRAENPERWSGYVGLLRACLLEWQPELILAPHAADAHPTHMGCHQLLLDALSSLPNESTYSPWLAFNEFWAPQARPNWLVGLGTHTVGHMLEALSLHRGEVARNPYHLSLPAWLIDNVRRGSERVLGAGAPAVDGEFAQLFEVVHWQNGRAQRWQAPTAASSMLSAAQSCAEHPLLQQMAIRVASQARA